MNKRLTNLLCTAAFVVGSAGFAFPAFAQDTTPAPATPSTAPATQTPPQAATPATDNQNSNGQTPAASRQCRRQLQGLAQRQRIVRLQLPRRRL